MLHSTLYPAFSTDSAVKTRLDYTPQLRPASRIINNVVDKYRPNVDHRLDSFTTSPMMFIPDKYYEQVLLSTLRSARQTVKIDLFFLGGEIGNKILDVLEEKAQQGVQIYFRDDSNLFFSLHGEIKTVRDKLKSWVALNKYPNFHYAAHKPYGLVGLTGVNHNKIILVDDSTALLSSKNPSDSEIPSADSTMLLQGTSARQLSDLFDSNWYFLKRAFPKRSHLPPIDIPFVSPHEGRLLISSRFRRNALSGVIQMIDEAKSTLDVHTFALGNVDILRAIYRAAIERGVKVRVLIDSSKDLPFRITNASTLLELRRFQELYPDRFEVKTYLHPELRNGNKFSHSVFHRYKNHQKLMIADGQRAIMGSTNFSNTDFLFQDNVSIDIKGGRAPRQLQNVFENDWQNNSQVPPPFSLIERLIANISKWIYVF
jgi:phosphatidylserine/phosphatidylglycerophosphate/cardiolipin synthase-like enzyme